MDDTKKGRNPPCPAIQRAVPRLGNRRSPGNLEAEKAQRDGMIPSEPDLHIETRHQEITRLKQMVADQEAQIEKAHQREQILRVHLLAVQEQKRRRKQKREEMKSVRRVREELGPNRKRDILTELMQQKHGYIINIPTGTSSRARSEQLYTNMK